MRFVFRCLLINFLLLCIAMNIGAQSKVEWRLTDPANSIFFKKQTALNGNRPMTMPSVSTGTAPEINIVLNDKQAFQSIDGFGFALTGGSAMNIMKMSASARADLLNDLFATDADHIGTSYLRVSIGASDLNEKVFSYDDLPAGTMDTSMLYFDLGPDKNDVIPVLKQILAINPAIKILASPWSPPAWMKTNNDTRGGSLKPEYYHAYAKYFVKYIQQMKEQGIDIDAVTIQNEPLHPGNNPSLLLLAPDEAIFIKDHLGPLFKKNNISTKIIIYDHNCDKPEYPISILNDSAAEKYIDGSAFHFYGGTIDALSKVHDAHPDKNLYFTEQWVGAPGNFKKDIANHIRDLIIGATRNWSRNVIEWNLASDPQYRPHTDRGGCDRCLGAITIDKDSIKKNPAYYIIAHAAKFVRPGSVRIASNTKPDLPNVAFKTKDGSFVLIVLNQSQSAQTFKVNYDSKLFITTLNPGAVATYQWHL